MVLSSNVSSMSRRLVANCSSANVMLEGPCQTVVCTAATTATRLFTTVILRGADVSMPQKVA